MDKNSTIRLSQAVRRLNVGSTTIVDYLLSKNFVIENNPNVKITPEQYGLLEAEFKTNAIEKTDARQLKIGVTPLLQEKEKKFKPKHIEKKETIIPLLEGTKSLGKVDLDALLKKPNPTATKITVVEEKPEVPDPSLINLHEKNQELIEKKLVPTTLEKPKLEKISLEGNHKLQGLTFLGKMDIMPEKSKKFTTHIDKYKSTTPSKTINITPTTNTNSTPYDITKKVRKRISPANHKEKRNFPSKPVISEQEVQDKLKSTLAKINQPKAKESSRTKFRKQKKQDFEQANLQAEANRQLDVKKLKISEFASPNDIASLINVPVNEIISTCVSLGIVVSINQRLDAEIISIVADEFGYKAEFVDVQQDGDEEIDKPEDLVARPPIVTIMGHVDHGKTSLLDYIQNLNIVKTEAGGITQHIGAYDVTTKTGHKIAFIDTPGHEAFTAMRARGAKITDIVVVVVAADDRVMPQTKEAISHAQAAGVPIVVAINKIDKPTANVDKIKEQLSAVGILTEDWGGKYQCESISAKTGEGIDSLLQKILLEAEILDLKANPNRSARGTVLEASLEKGRGYVSTIMVQNGTLHIGDPILAGAFFGKVKAMKNHLGIGQKIATPSTPVQVMGIEGAPQAGDIMRVMTSEREAREIATHRQQILREQNIRIKKHITLDEIGRRLAIGTFQELKIIVKGDVDGSVEALSDSLIKLSTDAFKLNVIYKGVGAISESDVLLASAADAIIVGFQVRPSTNARQLANSEGIDIRLYSIIYDAIENIKDAMQGMLAPTMQENITANIVVREVFKISKIGTIAGCYVTSGCIKRQHKIRIIRDGIVIFTGTIAQLKRAKDDVKEVKHGFECGININNFNDIKIDDTIEAFEEVEVESKL